MAEKNEQEATQEQTLIWAPDSYSSYEDDDEGAWVQVDPEGTVFLWTDWEDGAGVYWAQQTPVAEYVYQQLQISKQMGITAGVAFTLILRALGVDESTIQEGKLAGLMDDFEDASKKEEGQENG